MSGDLKIGPNKNGPKKPKEKQGKKEYQSEQALMSLKRR